MLISITRSSEALYTSHCLFSRGSAWLVQIVETPDHDSSVRVAHRCPTNAPSGESRGFFHFKNSIHHKEAREWSVISSTVESEIDRRTLPRHVPNRPHRQPHNRHWSSIRYPMISVPSTVRQPRVLASFKIRVLRRLKHISSTTPFSPLPMRMSPRSPAPPTQRPSSARGPAPSPQYSPAR